MSREKIPARVVVTCDACGANSRASRRQEGALLLKRHALVNMVKGLQL